jgi:hypothetical protein
MKKHEMKSEEDRIIIRRQNDPKGKPEPRVKPEYFQRYLVILGLDNMKKLTRAQKLAVIAEEFAHVYLKHGLIGGLEIEEEAAKLIKSWGFHPFSPLRARKQLC